MTPDPIIEEVREIRDRIAKAHGYDVVAILDHIRKLEAESGREHVTLPPRKTAEHATEADPQGPAWRG